MLCVRVAVEVVLGGGGMCGMSLEGLLAGNV